jgi:S1-C subfamily serine protease
MRAGFEPGDLIVEIAGYRIYNSNRLHGVLATFPHGSTVRVKVRRREREDQPWTEWPERELEMWLGDPQRPVAGPTGWRHVDWGFTCAYFDEGPGLRVHSSQHDALRPGDRIVGVEDREIREFYDFLRVLLDRNPGDTIRLKVRRGEEETEVSIPLRPPAAR